jgi:hypothetical protein
METNKPSIVCLDSTYMLQQNYPVSTILAVSDHLQGIPVSHMISSSEVTGVYRQFLISTFPKECPTTVVVDKSDAEIAAILDFATICEQDVRPRVCFFHITQAISRWLTSQGGGSHLKSYVLTAIRTIRGSLTRTSFETQRQILLKNLSNTDANDTAAYLEEEWFSCADLWVEAYQRHGDQIRTNNYIESFHRVLKYCFADRKKLRMDDFIELIAHRVGFHYEQKLRFPNSAKVRKYLHVSLKRAKSEYVDKGRVSKDESGNNSYLVASSRSSGGIYSVHLATPFGPSCSCLCKSALQCVHILASCLMLNGNSLQLSPDMPRGDRVNDTPSAFQPKHDTSPSKIQEPTEASAELSHISATLSQLLSATEKLNGKERLLLSSMLKKKAYALSSSTRVITPATVVFTKADIPARIKRKNRSTPGGDTVHQPMIEDDGLLPDSDDNDESFSDFDEYDSGIDSDLEEDELKLLEEH